MQITSTFQRLQIGATPMGMIFAFLAYFTFVLSDTSNKILIQDYSVFQIMLTISSVGATSVFVGCLCLNKLHLLKLTQFRHGIARGVTATLSAFCAIEGFARLDMAAAYALVFTAPLVIALMARFLLKEQVHIHRWIAVIMGFIGGLLVALPGWSLFSPISLFMDQSYESALTSDYLAGIGFILLSVLSLSSGNIYMRKFGHLEKPLALFFNSIMMVQLPILIVLFVSAFFMPSIADITNYHWPSSNHIGLFIWSCLFANLAPLLVISAFRLAPASALSPLQYTQIVWGVLIGALLFEKHPTSDVYVGTAIILLSGLLLVCRERQKIKEINIT